jgi:hypothetical protein
VRRGNGKIVKFCGFDLQAIESKGLFVENLKTLGFSISTTGRPPRVRLGLDFIQTARFPA